MTALPVRAGLGRTCRRLLLLALLAPCVAGAHTWMADLGNGTYANPLFHDGNRDTGS